MADFRLLKLAALLAGIAASRFSQAYEYGWNELAGTTLRSKCPANNYLGVSYDFRFYCKAVTLAWSGGTLDTKRHRLYIWGGGHSDYLGNELYALDIANGEMLRLTDPAVPLPRMEVGVTESELTPYNGTQPNARHTYDVVNYLPHHDIVMAWSGSLAAKNGDSDNWTWIYTPSTNRWKHVSPTGDIPEGAVASVSAYNPNDGLVYVHNRKYIYTYEFTADGGVWNKKSTQPQYLQLDVTAEIDPVSNRMYIFGRGEQSYYDLSANSDFSRHPISTAGWDNLSTSYAPGLAYDPVAKCVVGLGGAGQLYYLDGSSLTWSKKEFPNAPDKSGSVFGRFAYSPTYDAFVFYGMIDANGFVFKPVRDGVTVNAPTRPTALVVADKHYRTVLSWEPSTSDVGIARYTITRDGHVIGSTTQLTYPDDAVSQGESYSYKVSAIDAIGQTSQMSSPVSVVVSAMPRTSPQGDCSPYQRDDLVLCETFDTDTWWKKWDESQSKSDPKPATNGQTSDVVGTGCVTGNCLEVHMKKNTTWAIGLAYPLIKSGVHSDQAFLSYDIKLGPTWNPDSCDPITGEVVSVGGKFPGLADPRNYPEEQCGNGGAASDGINCWTARSQFGKTLGGFPEAVTRFGSYVYHPNQEGATGDAGYWDKNPVGSSGPRTTGCKGSPKEMACGIGTYNQLTAGEWYRVEMQVRMNTPGYKNGILRGWINGNMAYEKTNMEWRKPGHDDLHVRLVWFNVYKGGLVGGCQDGDVYFDNLVVTRDTPLGIAAKNRL